MYRHLNLYISIIDEYTDDTSHKSRSRSILVVNKKLYMNASSKLFGRRTERIKIGVPDSTYTITLLSMLPPPSSFH